MKHCRRVCGLQGIGIEEGSHWGSREGSATPERERERVDS